MIHKYIYIFATIVFPIFVYGEGNKIALVNFMDITSQEEYEETIRYYKKLPYVVSVNPITDRKAKYPYFSRCYRDRRAVKVVFKGSPKLFHSEYRNVLNNVYYFNRDACAVKPIYLPSGTSEKEKKELRRKYEKFKKEYLLKANIERVEVLEGKSYSGKYTIKLSMRRITDESKRVYTLRRMSMLGQKLTILGAIDEYEVPKEFNPTATETFHIGVPQAWVHIHYKKGTNKHCNAYVTEVYSESKEDALYVMGCINVRVVNKLKKISGNYVVIGDDKYDRVRNPRWPLNVAWVSGKYVVRIGDFPGRSLPYPVIKAYLKKYPSDLTKDYRFDKVKIAKEDFERKLQLMELCIHDEIEYEFRDKMHNEPEYIFADLLELGGKVQFETFPYDVKKTNKFIYKHYKNNIGKPLSQEDRKRIYEEVRAWWEKNKEYLKWDDKEQMAYFDIPEEKKGD